MCNQTPPPRIEFLPGQQHKSTFHSFEQKKNNNNNNHNLHRLVLVSVFLFYFT